MNAGFAEMGFDEWANAMQRFEQLYPTLQLELSPSQTLVLIGAVQVALRHPAFPPTSADLCIKFVRKIQETIAETEPILAAAIDRGFDPQFDEVIHQ